MSGSIGVDNSNKKLQTSCNLSTMENLTQMVQKFWEIEGFENDKQEVYLRRRVLRGIIQSEL